MDCQGARAEPEGRPGGPGDLKRTRWGPPGLLAFLLALPSGLLKELFTIFLVLLAFLLALPGLRGNPSSYPLSRRMFGGLFDAVQKPFMGRAPPLSRLLHLLQAQWSSEGTLGVPWQIPQLLAA